MLKKTFQVDTPPSKIAIEKGLTKGNITFSGIKYESKDDHKFHDVFAAFKNFKNAGQFFNQRVNLPEGLSEGVVSRYIDGIFRFEKIIKNNYGISKFDGFNEISKKFIEVKACSVFPDLTSWSPGPFFDLFYFVDFSSLDGKFKIFEINIDSNEIKKIKVSKTETFGDQIDKNRRPRFSVYEEFINPKKYCSGVPVIEKDLTLI